MCVCVCVCVSVCVVLASDSSETVEVTTIKPATVTATDMVMHNVLIMLPLPFIQGHTNLNHENNKCSIISDTVKPIPIKFAVEIVGLKV